VISGADNIILSALSEGKYIWNIGCRDFSGNITFGYSNYSFTLDSIAPSISILSPENNRIFRAGQKSVRVNITTDEYALCRYNISNRSFDFYGDIGELDTGNGYNHSFNYTGLSDGGEYKIYYKCRDAFSNVNGLLLSMNSVYLRLAWTMTETVRNWSGLLGI